VLRWIGYPCDQEELKELVKEYIKNNKLVTSFKNSKPGESCYYAFMKRHQNMTYKKPEQLQKLRKDSRKSEIIFVFYYKLENVCKKYNITDSCCV
jgi:hypothetical protein